MSMTPADYLARIAHLELTCRKRQAHIEDLENAHAAFVETVNTLRREKALLQCQVRSAEEDRDFWLRQYAAALQGEQAIVAGIWGAIGAAEERHAG